MFQLPVIVVLVISTFVSRVYPVVSADDHEKTKVEVVANSSNATEASIKPVNDKKEENATEVDVSAPTKSSTTVSTLPSINVEKVTKDTKQNCTSPKEQDDMLKCHVTPRDDDDIIEKNVSSSTEPTATTTTIASNKTEPSTESSQAPEINPGKDKGSGKEKEKEEDTALVVNSTEVTATVTYDVVTTETDHPINISNSDVSNVDSKNDTTTSEVRIEPAPPLLLEKPAASTGSEEVVGAVKSANQAKNRRMSSGTIALVTAISFAVAIALVYVAMIVWRRYIEYRYGHRELLVNELEFDTNDLRHFEL